MRSPAWDVIGRQQSDRRSLPPGRLHFARKSGFERVGDWSRSKKSAAPATSSRRTRTSRPATAHNPRNKPNTRPSNNKHRGQIMRDRFTLRTRKSSRIRTRQIAPLASAVSALAVVVPPASARTVTLHYFSKQTSSTFVTPQGKPLGPNSPPAVGDINDNTDLDYVGNHKHHAKRSTASDHLRCTITGSTGNSATATCDAQIAIGGSMLLANHTQTDVLREQRAGGGLDQRWDRHLSPRARNGHLDKRRKQRRPHDQGHVLTFSEASLTDPPGHGMRRILPMTPNGVG